MEIDKIFIECLKLPVFARIEYLETEQLNSNFSKETFLKILYDKWKEYKGIFFKNDLEKPFDELVKEKGWEYAALTVYGDEPEPFEHIYSENEVNEIETENLFTNSNENNFEWLNENVLWLLKDYIYRLYDKWDLPPVEVSGIIKRIKPTQQSKATIEHKQEGETKTDTPKELKEPDKLSKNDSVKKFLNDYMEGIECDLEVHNRINALTNGFNPVSLKIMLSDLDFYIEEIELFCNVDAAYKKEMTESFTSGCLSRLELAKQLREYIIFLINDTLSSQQTKTKSKQEQPKTFEELFYNPQHAELCLNILRELQPPVIDAMNNYIGKAKGIFPLWVKVLKTHAPKPLIKHFADKIYKDLLNDKIKGLELSKDASEFRKQYKRLENDNIELDIKAILSQYSQSGKLGK